MAKSNQNQSGDALKERLHAFVVEIAKRHFLGHPPDDATFQDYKARLEALLSGKDE